MPIAVLLLGLLLVISTYYPEQNLPRNLVFELPSPFSSAHSIFLSISVLIVAYFFGRRGYTACRDAFSAGLLYQRDGSYPLQRGTARRSRHLLCLLIGGPDEKLLDFSRICPVLVLPRPYFNCGRLSKCFLG